MTDAVRPRVSVVVPCRDGEVFIRQTAASVLNQSLADLELVLVDDGSTDGTLAAMESICQSDPRTRIVRHSTSRGVAAARNSGAAEATAPFLLFLDADDVLHPAMLATCLEQLVNYGACVAAHVRHRPIDEMGLPIPGIVESWPWGRWVASRFGARQLEPHIHATPFESVYPAAVIIPSMVVMRASAFRSAGCWDEHFGQGCEDTDLILRLMTVGEVHQVDRVLVDYRRHPRQASQRSDLAAQHTRMRSRWRAAAAREPALAQRVAHAEWFLERRLRPRLLMGHACRSLGRRRAREAVRLGLTAVRTYRLRDGSSA